MKIKYLSGILLLTGALALTACSDEDDYAASTTPLITEITTGDASVTAVSAAIDGTVKDLSHANATSYEVGVIYSTSADPTNGGTKVVGTFSNDTIKAQLTGLHTGTTYNYATYVCLQNKVYKYGGTKTFVATNAKAITKDAQDVSYTKASFSADYSGLEGLSNPEKGMKISMSKDNLADARDFDLTTVGGLLPGTKYYYAAYVKVGDGYVFGATKELTTKTQTTEAASGAVVFCIDIKDLYNELADPSKVKAQIVDIALDPDPTFSMDYSKTEFVNKDNNGVDGRIEIYNEYGNTKANGVDASALHFYGNMIVTFSISGIDGNLKEGASKAYRTELSYADADWNPSSWGGSSYGRATVTKDGTYTVFATLSGECKGAVVWTIELYNLWKDLKDPSKVKVTINKVETPGKIH